jgi:hypothetical protein
MSKEDKIIKLAEEFRCCPYCGNMNLDTNHYCNCKEGKKGFTEPDDAYWFAEYLKNNKELCKCDECVKKDQLIAELWAIAHGKIHINMYNEELGKIRGKILEFQKNGSHITGSP